LLSNSRPIVLLKKKIPIDHVSELDTVRVMLPYTALHYLVFDHYNKPIVLTSSNTQDEPITTDINEQFIPNILDHTRKIENPADDSVVKPIGITQGRLFHVVAGHVVGMGSRLKAGRESFPAQR